jgi:hypothetical protein
MVSERKTLIIFDTNVLRTTKEDEIAYSAFEFGFPYIKVKSFLDKNGLSDFVELAIPRIAVDELNKQKANSYLSDIKKLSKIHSRLSHMPNVDQASMKLPDTSFDYPTHVKQLAANYISEKKMRIIELPSDEKLKEFFQKILERALNSKPPFKSSSNYSDAGFKDALIWESILSYNDIKDFQKIILVTRDTGFDEKCIDEFKDTIQKDFFIEPSEDLAIDELSSIYEDFIENKAIFDFARDAYFRSYLEGQLSSMKFVLVDAQKYPISKFEILEPCESIENLQSDTEQEITPEERIVNSKIKITFKKAEVESQSLVTLRTLVDDERNISPIDSDPELTDS